MADNTRIEWADATLNYANGCSVVSPGCTNCYAMRAGGRNLPGHPSTGLTVPTKAGHVWTGEVRLNEAALLQALKWKRGRRIFWNAHGDLFHEGVPDEAIDRLFAVAALTPQHTHMILTKRPARMRAWFGRHFARGPVSHVLAELYVSNPDAAAVAPLTAERAISIGKAGWPLPNVHLGVSVEDQARADERIPDLLATPAAVRFISAEPLLGPVDLRAIEIPMGVGVDVFDALQFDFEHGEEDTAQGTATIDWVIAGGESGPGARPMHPDWARSLRDQCKAAGVAFHFKQWGEWAPLDAFGGVEDRPISDRRGRVRDWMNRYVVACRGYPDERGDRLRAHSFTQHATSLVYKVGKKRAGRLLDGRTWDEFPAAARPLREAAA